MGDAKLNIIIWFQRFDGGGLRVLSNFECQMKYEDDISSQMLCAGVDEDGKGSCHGDSGIY